MIAWTQGKQFDDYAQQLMTLLGQRGIPYRAIQTYVPKGPSSDAYWEYNLFFKNSLGLPTGTLVGPYAVRNVPPADVIDLALTNTLPEYEQLEQRDWGMSYTYEVHLGPFGLYGELRPNKIAGSGMYGGYEVPPETFGTPPPIPPPPMVEAPKPVPPAPVVQIPGRGTTPDASGIAALPGTGSAPPAPAAGGPVSVGMAEVLEFLLKADPQTIALIQMLLAMKR